MSSGSSRRSNCACEPDVAYIVAFINPEWSRAKKWPASWVPTCWTSNTPCPGSLVDHEIFGLKMMSALPTWPVDGLMNRSVTASAPLKEKLWSTNDTTLLPSDAAFVIWVSPAKLAMIVAGPTSSQAWKPRATAVSGSLPAAMLGRLAVVWSLTR